MYELTRHQAQNIVDKMMRDIPYNINIMDRTGVIIGSGNKSRIGTLHAGAVEAIRQQRAIEIFQDEELVKKGINLPIELNGLIVGVVGISGEVEETRPFGNLLRTAAILLLEQSIALEKESARSHRKQEFFSMLASPDTIYSQAFSEQALLYGLYLAKPSQVVYAEFQEDAAEADFPDTPVFKVTGNALCFVVQEANKLGPLTETIRGVNNNACLAVSNWTESVAEGFAQAKAAMRVLRGIYVREKQILYSQCAFIADMAWLQRSDLKAERLAHLLNKNEELIRTLQVYLNCNLNANETAAQLMIHRNTLHYRLAKIQQLTGKDPKNILELVELFFLLIYRVSI